MNNDEHLPEGVDLASQRGGGWRLLLLTLVIGLAACATRWPSLREDAMYRDEAVIYCQAHGIRWTRAWPVSWVHGDVAEDGSLLALLRRIARDDPYPPAPYLLVKGLDTLPDPILAFRLFGSTLWLGGLVLAAFWARRHGSTTMVVATVALFGLSLSLAARSQEIKHTALTPILGLLATLALSALVTNSHRRSASFPWLWALLYAASVGLGLLCQYTFVALVLGHLLYVAIAHRSRVRRVLYAACGSVPLWLPWYAYAASRQLEFCLQWFSADSRPRSLATGHSFTMTASGFFQEVFAVFQTLAGMCLPGESPFRMRHFAALFLVTWIPVALLLWRRQKHRSVLAEACMTSLLVGLSVQSAAAFVTNHAMTLQPHYFGYLFALSPLVIAQAQTAIRSRILRWSSIATTVVVLGFGQLAIGVRHQGVTARGLISITPVLVRFVNSATTEEDVLLFREAQNARLLNAAYRGSARQLWLGHGQPVPGGLCPVGGRVFVVESSDSASSLPPGRWEMIQVLDFGRTRVSVIRRLGA